jgi:hypothetical protein
MYAQIGGLREDPFRMFPIKHHGYVSIAFDYCEDAMILRSGLCGRLMSLTLRCHGLLTVCGSVINPRR